CIATLSSVIYSLSLHDALPISVARVNRIHLGRLSDPDDVRDIQIGIDRRFTGTDEIAFVRLHPVQRETILLRIDGDRANAELSRRSHNADRNLAAVGDQ